MATKTARTPATMPHHLFTVHEFELMGETGILLEDDRVELIYGEIVEMSPIGDRHASIVARLVDSFRRVPEEAILWIQNPVTLSGVSQPQPDVCLVRRRDDFYELGKPGPADVLLAIEVADSSLSYDKRVKLPLYGQAGVPEVWIVNLEKDCIEVSWDLRDGSYARTAVLNRGDSVAPGAVPEMRFTVDELLGSRLQR